MRGIVAEMTHLLKTLVLLPGGVSQYTSLELEASSVLARVALVSLVFRLSSIRTILPAG